MTVYADLGDLEEDKRITAIGQAAQIPGKLIAFVTDMVPPEKVERYIRKLLERFPNIEVVDRFIHTPIATTVTVRVRLKETKDA